MRTLKLSLFLVLFSIIISSLNLINPVNSFALYTVGQNKTNKPNEEFKYKKFGAELLKKNVILKLNKNYQAKIYVS